MSVDHVLHELTLRDGAAYRWQLPVSKRELVCALDAGVVRRPTRGVYVLPGADEALVLARRLRGARSHRTAASARGWSVVTTPVKPEIVVPRGRTARIPTDTRTRARLRWRDLSDAEVEAATVAPATTVVDCLRDLPPEEGVPVADSALRSGAVTPEEVASALAADRRNGARAARVWGASISPFAESVLESRLRMLGNDVPEIDLEPQVKIRGDAWTARVDLADTRLGIVAEADSFAWHGDRAALRRDCLRYNRLVAAGWRVLRFSYEAVFLDPDEVRGQLRAVARQAAASGPGAWAASLGDGRLEPAA